MSLRNFACHIGGQMIIPAEKIVLQCSCCSVPWAEIVNGTLIVVSPHHSNKHINALKLEDLERLLRQDKERRELAAV